MGTNTSQNGRKTEDAAADYASARLGWSANPGNTAYVTSAPTPSGPWTRSLNNSGVPINFTGSWTNALAGNPAPLVMPDGSINLYFTATPCPPNSGAKASNCIAVATSTSGYEGPFEMNAASHPITYPESEDPSVFIDKRGHYHLLTNVNTCHARCSQGIECGGHAWSRDGFVFSNLTVGAFGPYVTFRNGSTWANAYVERPLVTLDTDGTPLAFYVGMGRKGYSDSCNWPQLFCTGAPGEMCGPTVTPPHPPPSPPFRLRHGTDGCLTYNSTALAQKVAPCWNLSATNQGCGAYLGDCTAPETVWVFRDGGNGLQNFASPDLVLNFDCNKQLQGTPVWVLASGPQPLELQGGLLKVPNTDSCIGAGASAPAPARPCGPQQTWDLTGMATVVACSDASAAGWVSEPV